MAARNNSKKKIAKKSNMGFVKTLCSMAFFVSALGIYYSAYSGAKDLYMWIALLFISCIAVFSPDEVRK